MTQASGTPEELSRHLLAAGMGPNVIDAVLGIDAFLQNWRRQAGRRELGRRALIDLRIPLDLAQFDVLVAIQGSISEFGQSAGETMVATVAERLAIDPSRASRLVSEMVEAGYAQRAVSQADARRTIIELTEAGRVVVEAVRTYRFLIMGDFLSQWDEEELKRFVPLLYKFGGWSNHAETGVGKFAAEIEALAKTIATTATTPEPV